MLIYEYDSYKIYLKDEIQKRKRPGLMLELARAAGCDRTYLSQVLSGKAHLTADHILNLADSFALDEDQSDFLMLLLLRERSSNSVASARFEARINRIRAEKMRFERKLSPGVKPARLSNANLLQYYADWKFSATVILTSLEHCQSVHQISQKLGIQQDEASDILELLIKMNLVEKHGDRFVDTRKGLSTPPNTTLESIFHSSWRTRTTEQLRKPGGVHVSVPFSLSSEDAFLLKRRLLEFLEDQRKLVNATSAEQEAHVFCCDFFRID